MKMNFKENISKLFGFHAPTYYSWKKQDRPIIKLISKYFSNEEIYEFIETGKIKKFEYYKISIINSNRIYNIYLNLLKNNEISERLKIQTVVKFADYRVGIGSFISHNKLIDKETSSEALYKFINVLEEYNLFDDSLYEESKYLISCEFENLIEHSFVCAFSDDKETIYFFIKLFIFYKLMNLLNNDIEDIYTSTSQVFDGSVNDINKYLENKDIKNSKHEKVIYDLIRYLKEEINKYVNIESN